MCVAALLETLLCVWPFVRAAEIPSVVSIFAHFEAAVCSVTLCRPAENDHRIIKTSGVWL